MTDEPPSRARDIYGRKPVSQSRGRTQQRILDMQHVPGALPGADELLADAPPGSIGAGILEFVMQWVVHRPVTSKRAYERAMVLLARDLDANGPPLHGSAAALDMPRLGSHLAWRVDNGLTHPGELLRTGVHLARFADWLDEHHEAGVDASREDLRATAERLIADLGDRG